MLSPIVALNDVVIEFLKDDEAKAAEQCRNRIDAFEQRDGEYIYAIYDGTSGLPLTVYGLTLIYVTHMNKGMATIDVDPAMSQKDLRQRLEAARSELVNKTECPK